MRLTFLGTGAAGGVPRYGCSCPACIRALRDTSYSRKPCSALLSTGEYQLLLDAGIMDLHERFPSGKIQQIALTHFHPDHVQGLFHLRWGVGAKIPVYCPPDSEGCADLYKHPGILEFRPQSKFEVFEVNGFRLTPLPLIHSKVTFGYAIESSTGSRLCYVTDTVGLPPRTLDFLQDWKPHGMVIDCTDPPSPSELNIIKNHNDWDQALKLIEQINPERAWLTHLGHRCDSWLMEEKPELPAHVQLAQDGINVEFNGSRSC
jgi:phosphoribosyl 1,2-cyclic phosphate phosphodiesterase